jgi:hypothetical protein
MSILNAPSAGISKGPFVKAKPEFEDVIRKIRYIDEDVISGSKRQTVRSTDVVIISMKDASRDTSFFVTRLSRELRNTIGWNGIMISLGPDEDLKTISEPAARELYFHLKERFEGSKATEGEILVGQVWRSADKRTPDRKVEVVQLGNVYIKIKNLKSGVVTRVSLAGFKDKSRGYKLESSS